MRSRLADSLFRKHIVENMLFPQEDSKRFVAYIILLRLYPNLTYWSMDGYSCDALADYSKMIVWKDNTVIDWLTKEVLHTTDKSFYDCTTEEICRVWTRVNGETAATLIEEV